MHTLYSVEYRWDPAKAAENADKHDVRFSDAVAVLEDDFARTLRDAYSEEEERFVTMGTDALGRLLVVVSAHRGDHIRIISARRATSRERRAYEEAP